MDDLNFSKPIMRIDKFIKVDDNWYPTFPNNQVNMSLIFNYFKLNKTDSNKLVRCCVWGADDFGLEIDFESESLNELKDKFLEWKKYLYDEIPEITNKEYFYNLGFIDA